MHIFSQVDPVKVNMGAGVLAIRGAKSSTKEVWLIVEWSSPSSTTCLEGFVKLVLCVLFQYCCECFVEINI